MTTFPNVAPRPPPGEAPPPPPPGIGGAANPPALWQPPGSPASSPAAAERGLAPTGQGIETELQKEIQVTIENQVKRLIEQARLETENLVKVELKHIRDMMTAIGGNLDQMIVQLDDLESTPSAEAPLDGEIIGHILSKIEQQWGQEIKTLKQELHQTIVAHNHNADLIKHHEDSIDSLRDRCVKMQNANSKTSEIQAQLQKVDARLKAQMKLRKLEPLFERLSDLEKKIAVAASASQGAAAAAWRGYAGMPAGMPPGIPPGMMPAIQYAPPGMTTGMSQAKAQLMAAGVRNVKAAQAAAAAAAEANTES